MGNFLPYLLGNLGQTGSQVLETKRKQEVSKLLNDLILSALRESQPTTKNIPAVTKDVTAPDPQRLYLEKFLEAIAPKGAPSGTEAFKRFSPDITTPEVVTPARTETTYPQQADWLSSMIQSPAYERITRMNPEIGTSLVQYLKGIGKQPSAAEQLSRMKLGGISGLTPAEKKETLYGIRDEKVSFTERKWNERKTFADKKLADGDWSISKYSEFIWGEKPSLAKQMKEGLKAKEEVMGRKLTDKEKRVTILGITETTAKLSPVDRKKLDQLFRKEYKIWETGIDDARKDRDEARQNTVDKNFIQQTAKSYQDMGKGRFSHEGKEALIKHKEFTKVLGYYNTYQSSYGDPVLEWQKMDKVGNPIVPTDREPGSYWILNPVETSMEERTDTTPPSDKVTVISPEGVEGIIPRSQLAEATKQGYKEIK